MSALNILGTEYTLEQDAVGNWYYRQEYPQHFGKKVKLRDKYLMVWNPGKSVISVAEVTGGTGSI